MPISFKDVLVISILLIASCKSDRKQVDVSGIPLEVKAARLDQDLFSSRGENIASLQNKYGAFFDLYCFKLIEVGTLDTSLLKTRLNDFTTDADMTEIYGMSEKIFRDFSSIDGQLTDAFRHYHYYFPKKPVPQVVTFISGFNYGIVAADSALGIGVDMYLGEDTKYYPGLQFPHYKIRRMRKEYIAADALRGWAESEWEQDRQQNDFLSQAVYYGKILHFMDQVFPETPDSIKTGFMASQLKWCNANERSIWSFILDQKLLFSNDQNQVMKFINDGPTTNGFPKESPGAIGQWLGWKIVQAYVKNNPDVTLDQLLNNLDTKKILNDSKYKPEK